MSVLICVTFLHDHLAINTMSVFSLLRHVTFLQDNLVSNTVCVLFLYIFVKGCGAKNLSLDSIGRPKAWANMMKPTLMYFKGVNKRVIVADALLEKILLLTTL